MMTSQPVPHGLAELDERRPALLARCRSAITVLPSGTVFSHLTAAALLGLPMSYAMEAETRLHCIRPITMGQARIDGVVGHRALHPREVVMVEGLPVVGLADTWVDLGELVGRGKPVGLDDLIVVGDACATALESVIPLRRALAARVRPRGKRTLLEALDLIRVGSWSPRETLARIMLVRAGLPEPKLNVRIYSMAIPDLLLGVGDLVWHEERPGEEDIKVIGEYQGLAFHGSRPQRLRDRRRRGGLESDGWQVEDIWAENMADRHPRELTVIRFAEALRFPVGGLDLSAVEPQFLSRHAIFEAQQRDDLWRERQYRRA